MLHVGVSPGNDSWPTNPVSFIDQELKSEESTFGSNGHERSARSGVSPGLVNPPSASGSNGEAVSFGPHSTVAALNELAHQRAAWQEAERTKQRLERILDSIADALVSLDLQGKIIYLNRQAAELLGQPVEGCTGKIFWRELPDLRETKLESEYHRAMQEQRPAEMERFFPRSQRWYTIKIYPAPDGSSVVFHDITARKHSEEALWVNTQRFRLASLSDAITLYEQDLQLRYTWLYPEHLEHHGALGKTDEEIVGAEDGAMLARWKREVLLTGAQQRREVRVQLQAGVRHYEVSILPKRNEAGEIVGVAGAALDISERKAAQETNQRLAAIVESSDDAIISKNLDGIVTSWNRSAERIFGYTAAEIIGKSITLLMGPGRHFEEQNILSQIRQGNRVDHYETVRLHKDGSTLQISLSISPIRDGDGKIIGVSKIARDITSRKHTELQQQALYELVARVNRAEALPEIYDAALDAICRSQKTPRAAILLSDTDGVMRFKAWRGLSESYRKTVEGHCPWKLDDPAPQAVWIDDIATARLDEALRATVCGEGIRALAFVPLTYERRLLGKFMIYYDTPHRFEPDELRPAETMASQVGFALERQRSEQALEALVNERTGSLREAIAQMEEFSYSVSHDLRSPARAMQGYAIALLEDYGERLDEEGREFLNRIIRSSTRMDRLIQDILTYSRLSRRELKLHPIPLDRLVLEVIQQYPEMRTPKAEITIVGPLLPVIGHEPSVSQILSNLLSNAVKFVAPGQQPKVNVFSERRGDFVRLWIEDNGIGIRAEHHQRLFGMFERIHPDKRYEGTGIGLAIVRKAAERMGGATGVESEGEKGSRFWVELPSA